MRIACLFPIIVWLSISRTVIRSNTLQIADVNAIGLYSFDVVGFLTFGIGFSIFEAVVVAFFLFPDLMSDDVTLIFVIEILTVKNKNRTGRFK
jgi:hypothetical protein